MDWKGLQDASLALLHKLDQSGTINTYNVTEQGIDTVTKVSKIPFNNYVPLTTCTLAFSNVRPVSFAVLSRNIVIRTFRLKLTTYHTS